MHTPHPAAPHCLLISFPNISRTSQEEGSCHSNSFYLITFLITKLWLCISLLHNRAEWTPNSLHLRSKQIVLSCMEGREVQCVPLSLSSTAVPCWHSQHSCSQLFWPVWVMPPLQLGRGLLMPGGTYYREKVAVGTGHTWQSTPGFLFPFPLKL